MFGHAWRIGLASQTFGLGLGLGLVRCWRLSDWLLPCLLLHCSLCVQLPDQAGKANDCSVSDWTQAAKRIIVRSDVLGVEHLEQLFGLGGSAAASCYTLATPVSTLQKTSELLFALTPGRKQLAAANIGSLKKNYLEVDKPELNTL